MAMMGFAQTMKMKNGTTLEKRADFNVRSSDNPGCRCSADSAQSKAGSVASAIKDAGLYRGMVFPLPTQPIAAGTCTATFADARNGAAINKSWRFTAFRSGQSSMNSLASDGQD